MTRAFLTAAVAATLLLAGCGTSFESKDLPELSVAMGGEPGQFSYAFSNVTPGTKVTVEVSLSNLGLADLEIRGLTT